MGLYHDYADRTAKLIAEGVLRPGEKLLSVRQACKIHGISPITVTQAYHLLESRGLMLTAVDSRTNPASTAGTAQHDLDLVSG